MLGQRTLRVGIQEFTPDNYAQLADIYNAIYPGYDRTPDEWKLDDENLVKSKHYFKRYTCLDHASNEPVGFGQVNHGQWTFHPTKFWIDLLVHPKHQRQGVGTALYGQLDKDLTGLGATTIWVQSKEDKPDSSRFLSKRGFQEKMRVWESHLDPSKVDLSKYKQYSEKAAAEGIKISTLVEEMKRDAGWEKKLYELVQTVAADMPMPGQFTPVPFDQWQTFEMKNPNLLPDGYMIAKDGSDYVGLSTVWKHQKKPGNLWQGLTGVLRKYRGRGIAMTLKTKVIEYALQNNYGFIRTFNDSTNVPMLGINVKIGFKREIGWITFEKAMA